MDADYIRDRVSMQHNLMKRKFRPSATTKLNICGTFLQKRMSMNFFFVEN